MKTPKIEVVVMTTEGYQQRFTAACLDQLKRRENILRLEGEMKNGQVNNYR